MRFVFLAYVGIHVPFLHFLSFFLDKKVNIPVEKQYQIYWSENGQNVANKVIVEDNIMKISSKISFYDFVNGSFTDQFVAEKLGDVDHNAANNYGYHVFHNPPFS